MPRADDDIASLECPICGHRELPPADPTPEPEPISVPVAPPPRRNAYGLLVVLGSVAIVAFIATVLLNLPRRDEQPVPPSDDEPTPVVAVATVTTPPTVSPTVVVAVVPEEAPVPRFVPELAPIPRVFVAVVETVPRPRALVVPIDNAKVIAIDRPNGDYELPVLRNRAKVKLVGRVGRLIVRGVEDGAALDALDLSTREVVFVGKVDGGSTARVRTTNGVIKFQAKVDGASEVVAEAPEGTVTFMSHASSQGYGPTIDGGAQVTVAARLVVIGVIMGADTRVDVTLYPTSSAPSFLRVGLIDGPSMVRYRNVAGSKGKPNVLPGELRGGAVLKHDK